MIKKVKLVIIRNLRSLFYSIKDFINPRKAKSIAFCRNLIINKSGFEVGGPSTLLFSKKGVLPLYPYVKSLDNCNFSKQTIWDGLIEEGNTFKYDENRKNGYQYILESTELSKIPSGCYDFVLSSHVIEHIANPIKALYEWIRILKNNGNLIVVIPHKDGTFDHNRKITALSHMVDDFNSNMKEDDLTHLEEILEFHDFDNDIGIKSPGEFKERAMKNLENRSLHHHVFDTYAAFKLIDYVKLKILIVESIPPCDILIVARKSQDHDNSDIKTKLENYRFKNPLKTNESLFLSININNVS